jgi:Fe-S-cluster containining protein
MSFELRRIRASNQLDDFFKNISPELKAFVEALPQRIAKKNARPAIKLKEILLTADRLYSYANGFAACKKGCSYCCHLSIPIYAFEARFIGESIKVNPVELKHNIRRDSNKFSEKTPCTFLVNNECSIYENRPLACRTLVNFDIDNYYCQFENWNSPENAVPKPTIHPILFAYKQLAESSNSVIADIRDFFPNGGM